MPTLVTKPTTEMPASSVRTSDPSLNASITMSSPPRNGGSTNDAATALTLSLGGVHFCLQPTDCASGVALNRRDGNIVLSLTSFTGSLVVSTEGNLVALQALAGQAKQQAHATVEEEPHSPELLDKTNGQCKKGGTANKVSPGQQTLPFVVKKQVDKKKNNNCKKKQHKDPITTPITKNTKDRKRRNSIDDKADIDDSNTLSTEVASKKSRRGFFTLPTKKTADNNSNNKVDDIEEVKEPNSSGVVEDVPVFQTSQTQFTQSEEEGSDEQENSDNSNKGDDGMVDDVDVSQTMESSSYTTNNSVITTTTMNDVVAHQGKDGCESVATARGDEADEVLDEAGDMNDDDDEDGGDVKMENGGVVLQQQEHSTAVTTEIGSDDVEMIAGGGIEIAGYPAPPARWGHTMTTIQDDRILVYGGQSFDLEGNPIILSDVHIYSPSKRTWEKPINCRGESRQWHTATYIPQRQMVIAFGGETEETSTSSSTSAKKGQTITKVKTSETLRVLDTDIMLWYPVRKKGLVLEVDVMIQQRCVLLF
jgi:Galactose oxidase, central domain